MEETWSSVELSEETTYNDLSMSFEFDELSSFEEDILDSSDLAILEFLSSSEEESPKQEGYSVEEDSRTLKEKFINRSIVDEVSDEEFYEFLVSPEDQEEIDRKTKLIRQASGFEPHLTLMEDENGNLRPFTASELEGDFTQLLRKFIKNFEGSAGRTVQSLKNSMSNLEMLTYQSTETVLNNPSFLAAGSMLNAITKETGVQPAQALYAAFVINYCRDGIVDQKAMDLTRRIPMTPELYALDGGYITLKRRTEGGKTKYLFPDNVTDIRPNHLFTRHLVLEYFTSYDTSRPFETFISPNLMDNQTVIIEPPETITVPQGGQVVYNDCMLLESLNDRVAYFDDLDNFPQGNFLYVIPPQDYDFDALPDQEGYRKMYIPREERYILVYGSPDAIQWDQFPQLYSLITEGGIPFPINFCVPGFSWQHLSCSSKYWKDAVGDDLVVGDYVLSSYPHLTSAVSKTLSVNGKVGLGTIQIYFGGRREYYGGTENDPLQNLKPGKCGNLLLQSKISGNYWSSVQQDVKTSKITLRKLRDMVNDFLESRGKDSFRPSRNTGGMVCLAMLLKETFGWYSDEHSWLELSYFLLIKFYGHQDSFFLYDPSDGRYTFVQT